MTEWKYIKGTKRHYVDGPAWFDTEAGIMSEEDARLIAAAPDGLKLAERVIEYFSGATDIEDARKELEELRLECDLEVLNMAVDMRAKAKGEI